MEIVGTIKSISKEFGQRFFHNEEGGGKRASDFFYVNVIDFRYGSKDPELVGFPEELSIETLHPLPFEAKVKLTLEVVPLPDGFAANLANFG